MIIKKAVQDQLKIINADVDEQLEAVDKVVANKLQELNKSSEVNVSAKKNKRKK